jgi:hypothetical protein
VPQLIWFGQKYPTLKLMAPIMAVGIMLSSTACSGTVSFVNKYRTSGGNAQMFPNIDLPAGGGFRVFCHLIRRYKQITILSLQIGPTP